MLSATGAVRANAKRGAARGGLRGRARAGHAGTGEGTRGGQTEACRRAGHLLENDFKHFDLCCAGINARVLARELRSGKTSGEASARGPGVGAGDCEEDRRAR